MYIGNLLRALRKKKKMTLTDIANGSGIQLATLSRIENQKMVGTLDSHLKIAKALGVDITDLYRQVSKDSVIIEVLDKSSPVDIISQNTDFSSEILTKNILDKKMLPTLLRIEENGKTNLEQAKPGTEKFIYVLDGKIEANIGEEKYSLSKNDSLYFESNVPHYLRNTGTGESHLICIISPPIS